MSTIEPAAQRVELKRRVAPSDPNVLIDFLHQYSGLSKQQLKDAAYKGAVLLRRDGSVRRLRRAKAVLQVGDRIELHYDRAILALEPPSAHCIADRERYSVWFKPAGMLAQGNEFGDHCALLRVAEVAWPAPRKVWLIHRLDREAIGLMVVAHTQPVAANLSHQFQYNQVRKHYRVQVRGDIAAEYGPQGRIDMPLDGKTAVTEFRVEALIQSDDVANNISTLAVEIHTGRLHQIRRHLAAIGHPVIGDPRYGTGNKDAGGLRLAAVGLAFQCPVSRKPVEFRLTPEDIGF
ncbi:MAG: RluA family pseudouridine synthase [Gammaproteobacteria bacterium]|nr:RluA family pseudouridine synthase [Gammaproteobacteria bacterium]